MKDLVSYCTEIKPSDESLYHVLPVNISAGGWRPGAINFLSQCMPAELVCVVTGQELKSKGAVFEILDAALANCMPGAIAQSGHPPLPWGRLGMGPSPPTFAALVDDDPAKWRAYTLRMFRLDSESLPLLSRKEDLYYGVLCASASQVMYYEERHLAGEVGHTLALMNEAVHTIFGIDDPHLFLVAKGKEIRVKFNKDNLHLSSLSEGSDAVSKVLSTLSYTLSSLDSVTASLSSQVEALQRQVQALVR